jgi:hypothetical protein
MKTYYWLFIILLFCITFHVNAQGVDYYNDTIFTPGDKVIKCELIALTKDKIYYRTYPDRIIKYILAPNAKYVQNNPPPNIEELQNEYIACFDMDGCCGFITINGIIILPAMFENADNFTEGVASVRFNKKWGYIDIYGNWVIQPGFERAEPFQNGVARVRYREKWGVIDKTGKWVIDPDYMRLWDFVKIK